MRCLPASRSRREVEPSASSSVLMLASRTRSSSGYQSAQLLHQSDPLKRSLIEPWPCPLVIQMPSLPFQQPHFQVAGPAISSSRICFLVLPLPVPYANLPCSADSLFQSTLFFLNISTLLWVLRNCLSSEDWSRLVDSSLLMCATCSESSRLMMAKSGRPSEP